ncbi:protein of unknown function [Rhodovastum atsumiense]|nr:protein of unknown function [Rhodovastum atsumiense]
MIRPGAPKRPRSGRSCARRANAGCFRRSSRRADGTAGEHRFPRHLRVRRHGPDEASPRLSGPFFISCPHVRRLTARMTAARYGSGMNSILTRQSQSNEKNIYAKSILG